MENKRLTVGLFLADVADDFSRGICREIPVGMNQTASLTLQKELIKMITHGKDRFCKELMEKRI